MSGYLFIFGNTPQLAFSELQSFFPDATLISEAVAYDMGLVDIDKLGGTVKIAEIVGDLPNISAKNLAHFLKPSQTFGISFYCHSGVKNLEQEIKKILGKARYVKAQNALSSVVVAKKHVTELVLVKDKSKWLVGKTIAVQDFEKWARRDRGRPYADPRSGMLPLKVARMAVNIAGRGGVLLDPFCGMGTILGEAIVAGCKAIGSDQSPEVIEKAEKNVPGARLLVCDATHISEKIEPDSIDAIVTEPFLGDPNPKSENIKNTIKGLEKLYIGCLKDWKKVLKPKAKLVIALPEYAVGNQTFFVKKVIDNCETYGYTVLTGPIAYHRPQAVVRRKFYILQKT